MKNVALIVSVSLLAIMGVGSVSLADGHGHDHSGHMHKHEHTEHNDALPHDHEALHTADAHAHIINNDGEEIGHAHISKATDGVLIHIKLAGLPAGKRGMHFHEVGDCSDHDHFKAAGAHIEHEKPHGFLHPEGPHAGNLPNLIVHEDGTAELELYSNLVSINGETFPLLDEDGSTLMIHENVDDHLTQPIGGSGARIACGVIRTK
ncbi:MAG: superoxide dismutase family protein [Pseudomonadota bacterium]